MCIRDRLVQINRHPQALGSGDYILRHTPEGHLEYGVRYNLQNQGPGGVYLSEQAAAPDIGDPAFILPLLGVWGFTPEAGAEIYIWTLGSDGLIVVSEA